MSHLTYLRSQMARAASLEDQLGALPKSSEEEASRIRIQLCEVFSDVLLTDPQFALRKDCSGRLWRSCFYARINELRSRIAREQRKSPGSVEKLQNNLQVFLKEAIVLYKYLVEKYESKLSEKSASQDSSAATEGVVPGLHRILIHLGDLYRYSKSYGNAEKAYGKAARLAPGKGNPYNQLAVVAQLKDPSAPLSCVALYYYSRALLASHDAFETSKANLSRLLESNRVWLEASTEADMLAAAQKKTTDKVRAQRTVQSRRFLAEFVNLHYDFFQKDETTTINKMETLLDQLQLMLKEWAFGDSLLVKMATINAFSVHWTAPNNAFGRAFVLRFGVALAQRLELSLRKKSTSSSSLRLLLPLVLVCDYVSTWEDSTTDMDLGMEATQFCNESKQSYYDKIASVATHLSPLADSMDSTTSGTRLKEYDNLCGFLPFDAFVNAHPDEVYLSVEEAIRVLDLSLTQETSTQNSASGPEENSVKMNRFFGSVNKMVEAKRLRRTSDGTYCVVPPTKETELTVEDEEMEDDNPVADFDSVGPVMDTEPSRSATAGDNEGPMLVYKHSDSGIALLVPGALLAVAKNQEQEVAAAAKEIEQPSVAVPTAKFPKESRQDTVKSLLFSGATAKNSVELAMEDRPTTPAVPPEPTLGPPPGILPPPGFGAPTNAAATGLGVRAPQPPLPAVEGLAFPYAFGQQSTFPLASSYAQPGIPQGFSDSDTVLGMLRGTQVNTANPFMSPPAPVFGLFPPQSSSSTQFLDLDIDGTSLLDSSLLSSILMDENTSQTQSKNPFLT